MDQKSNRSQFLWLKSIARKIKPWQGAVLFSLLYVVITFYAASRYDLWWPTTTRNGLRTDYVAWINNYVFQPMIIYYFLGLNTEINKLFSSLIQNRVFSMTAVNQIVFNYRALVTKKWLTILYLTIAFVLTAVPYIAFTSERITTIFCPPSPAWWMDHTEIYLIGSPLIFLACYALSSVIFRVVVLQFSMSKLFANPSLTVQNKHPDNAGGLGQIGQFSAYLAKFFIVIFFWLFASYFQSPDNFPNDYLLHCCLIMYLFLAPLMFFVAIHAAWKGMKAFRDNEIKKASDRWILVKGDLDQQKVGSMEYENAEKILTQIDAQIKRAKDLPVLPFAIGAKIKYILSIIFILIQLIASIIEILKNAR